MTVYYHNCAQWYDEFLQVGRLYRALILLGIALYHPNASVSSIFNFLVIPTSFSLPFSELSLVGLALDVVDYNHALSFSAVTLLVGSSDP